MELEHPNGIEDLSYSFCLLRMQVRTNLYAPLNLMLPDCRRLASDCNYDVMTWPSGMI